MQLTEARRLVSIWSVPAFAQPSKPQRMKDSRAQLAKHFAFFASAIRAATQNLCIAKGRASQEAVAHSVPTTQDNRASFISMFHDHTVRRRMGFWREEPRCKNAAHGCAVDRLWVETGAERRDDAGHTRVFTMGINNFHKWVDATFACTQNLRQGSTARTCCGYEFAWSMARPAKRTRRRKPTSSSSSGSRGCWTSGGRAPRCARRKR